MRPWPLILLLAGFARAQADPLDPSQDQVPGDWTGPVFQLNADYPATMPAEEAYPWRAYDFATEPRQYIEAVLAYAFEGNIRADAAECFDPVQNATRAWYHAPGMAPPSGRGREFIHGLTPERSSRPGELHPNQTSSFDNWAVGLYNDRGGYTLGRVWEGGIPDPMSVEFPEGTVSFKLLFTMATVSQVPFLDGAPEWQANVNRNAHTGATPPSLRLLQVDVAVRDRRADATTGWVFGTFIYSKDAPGAEPWRKLVPVGLMWGNDPNVHSSDYSSETMPAEGEINPDLRETWINPDVVAPATRLVQHLGWLGRLNGPVDNPSSSCLSCHGTAQSPLGGMVFRSGSATSERRYFRNIPAGHAFTTGRASLDYSLQLAFGIRSFPPPGLVGSVSDETVLREGIVDPEEGEAPAPARAETTGTPGGETSGFGALPLILAAAAVLVIVILVVIRRSS